MRNKRGITLVSLVVTIIVLIILAGVSINLTIGENGIITMAKKARENMELAAIEEETKLNALYTQIELEDENIGGIDNSSISKLIEFKQKVASAITDMGIETLETANADTMASNIRNISTNKDASSINYNNIDSGLSSTNVQGALDEVNNNLEWKKLGTVTGSSSLELPNDFKEICAISKGMIINIPYNVLTDAQQTFRTSTFDTNTYYIGHVLFSVSISKYSIKINQICSITYPSLGGGTSGEYKDLSSTSSMEVYYK